MSKNYIDEIVDQLHPLLDDCPVDLLRLYALLVLIKGEDVMNQDVHDAWSVWRTTTRPDHPSLIRFEELPADVQALDSAYTNAIRIVAGQLTVPKDSEG